MKEFLKDQEFWTAGEKELEWVLTKLWLKFTSTSDLDILDFEVYTEKGERIYLELKTRRCEKDTYKDTMIWVNKLTEAYSRYNKEWAKTLFLFKFTDGFYFINPFEWKLPRFSYWLWRFDRLGFDKPKGHIFYGREDLIKI